MRSSSRYPRLRVYLLNTFFAVFLLFSLTAVVQAGQNAHDNSPADPGPRNDAAQAGPLPNLTANEFAAFTSGKTVFQEVDSVSGTLTNGSGLGPRFNMDSCAGCHAQPAVGGSSPSLNPQIAVATKAGATNKVPSFLSSYGPVKVTRFLRNPDGTPDGGVHAIYVISGRSDAKGCSILQPDYDSAITSKNIAFRIPTPLFGAGLIEAIDDDTILANLTANTSHKSALGIAGHANRNGNDGTVTRFGWKAQNKSLTIFAGEAYNVEQGVTNDVFPNERETTAGCKINATPEDHINVNNNGLNNIASDVVQFVFFMRFLAPANPAHSSTSTTNGQGVFNSVGCALCHVPAMTTGSNVTAALSNKPANLYSDLLVHNMGSGLADGVSQGNASGNEFRTAPLWGLGQRLFLLHDGRSSDLGDAIAAHSSSGSEANGVISNYNSLASQQKQDLLNFLRSL
jgi:CxxC motif-containing protein (DUF1111 family)